MKEKTEYKLIFVDSSTQEEVQKEIFEPLILQSSQFLSNQIKDFPEQKELYLFVNGLEPDLFDLYQRSYNEEVRETLQGEKFNQLLELSHLLMDDKFVQLLRSTGKKPDLNLPLNLLADFYRNDFYDRIPDDLTVKEDFFDTWVTLTKPVEHNGHLLDLSQVLSRYTSNRKVINGLQLLIISWSHNKVLPEIGFLDEDFFKSSDLVDRYIVAESVFKLPFDSSFEKSKENDIYSICVDSSKKQEIKFTLSGIRFCGPSKVFQIRRASEENQERDYFEITREDLRNSFTVIFPGNETEIGLKIDFSSKEEPEVWYSCFDRGFEIRYWNLAGYKIGLMTLLRENEKIVFTKNNRYGDCFFIRELIQDSKQVVYTRYQEICFRLTDREYRFTCNNNITSSYEEILKICQESGSRLVEGWLKLYLEHDKCSVFDLNGHYQGCLRYKCPGSVSFNGISKQGLAVFENRHHFRVRWVELPNIICYRHHFRLPNLDLKIFKFRSGEIEILLNNKNYPFSPSHQDIHINSDHYNIHINSDHYNIRMVIDLSIGLINRFEIHIHSTNKTIPLSMNHDGLIDISPSLTELFLGYIAVEDVLKVNYQIPSLD